MTYDGSGIVFNDLPGQFRYISSKVATWLGAKIQNYHKKVNKHPILFQSTDSGVSLWSD